METITITQILTIAGTTAAPILISGVLGFFSLKTKVAVVTAKVESLGDRADVKMDALTESNAIEHSGITRRLDTANGHVAEAQLAIAEARVEIEGIKSTCTERGRLEKEIRAQVNLDLENLKEKGA